MILRQDHLLSAPNLLERLKDDKITVNKTSVYRALEVLQEQGFVSKKVLKEEVLYELSGHHHDHIVCTNCGLVRSIDCAFEAPSLPAGYVLEDHSLTLYAKCPDCSV